jgi:glycosyltransferase involved in cell wall biosynthesis
MQISIVTPAYDAERWLVPTVESVLAQTHADWEYVIVDDGSRDATASVAAGLAGRDSRIRVHRQANAGVAAARNAGIDLMSATTRAVIFLDADDLWRPNTLELLIRALEAAPHAPAAHGRAACIDADGNAIPLVGYEQEGRRYVRPRAGLSLAPLELALLGDQEPTHFAALALQNPISTPGQVLIRRDALNRVGKFDTHAKPAEDWDLWLRLSLLGPFRYLPETVIDYRRHAANASSQLSKMRKADLHVRHKALKATGGSYPEQHQAVRLSLRYTELERCRTRLGRAASAFANLELKAGAKELGRASLSLVECAKSLR